VNLADLTVDRFVRLLAGGTPTPGGGSAAALAGALSAALCSMCARVTLGKKKYQDIQPAMEGLKLAAVALMEEFLALVSEDAGAYDGVVAALRLPKESEAQGESRRQALERANQQAAAVPLRTLELLARIPPLVAEALERANPNCLTDAGVALQLALAAAQGAAYSVRINLTTFLDGKRAEEWGRQTLELLDTLETAAEPLRLRIEERLGRKT
jgi:methenyltetrahydrofolate cyclohydrolase